MSSRIAVIGVVVMSALWGAAAWAAPADGERAAKVVYQSDFSKAATNHWSHPTTAPAPNGARTFLGEFVNDAVTLTLGDLPAHGRVRVSFDLIITQSWDGNLADYGPDIWDLTVDAGPNLVHTTFSNMPFYKDIQTQSFPGRFPFDKAEPMTGAAETNTLGYTHPFGVANQPLTPCDAVYRVTRTFAHSDKSLRLIFTGTNLETKPNNETWGLDRVKVEVLPADAATPLDVDQFSRAWAKLGEESAESAAPALAAISEAGNGVVARVREHLALKSTAAAADADMDKEVVKLIAQLDADEFAAREKATEALKKLGLAAEPELRKALAGSPSPEAKARMESLLAKPEADDATNKSLAEPVDRQAWRIVAALELIGTDDAKKLLTDLAAQDRWKPAADEAQSALVRLAGKGQSPTPAPFNPNANANAAGQ